MLGFTAHSEVPIGEFESSPHRQAPVTGVSATGAVRQLSLGADQVFAATGVTGTAAARCLIINARYLLRFASLAPQKKHQH